MKIDVTNIKSSKCDKLSKILTDQSGTKDKLEEGLTEDAIILKTRRNPRDGWDKEFQKMHLNEDDELLILDVFEDEDFDEWK